MRIIFVMMISVFGLAGCQSASNSGSPGQCNQVGNTVSASVMCPSG